MQTRLFNPSTDGVNASNEVSFPCPHCGSPHVATFEQGDPRSRELRDFVCNAGDCGYTGSVTRS